MRREEGDKWVRKTERKHIRTERKKKNEEEEVKTSGRGRKRVKK